MYCHPGRNVVGIAGFKSDFGLWFFQGVLLNDPEGVLSNAQAGKTRAQRQMRFQSAREIRKSLILIYVREATEIAATGLKVPAERQEPLEISPDLKEALQHNPAAAVSFDRMSPSCQREYAEYIAEAKMPETRARRLAKIMPMIETWGDE